MECRPDDGTPISRAQRVYFREHHELEQRFHDPFSSARGGYYDWLSSEGPGIDAVELAFSDSIASLRLAARRLQEIEATSAYKLYRASARLRDRLLLRKWVPA